MSANTVPNEEVVRKQMEILVRKVDLETMTRKQFIRALSTQMDGADLSTRKTYIKATLTAVLDAMDDDNIASDEETEDESDTENKRKKKKEKKKSTGTARKATGLTVVKKISGELSAFLGTDKDQMARTEVVKALWAYIKQHDLQNPEDKREILLDENMKALFKVDKFTMFTLNKYVGAHIEPFTPVNLEQLSANSKKKKEEAARKRKAKLEAKQGKKKKVKRKAGTHPPYRLSEALRKVVEKDILPRPQVTQALWVYIKKNNLQSESDKRVIVCDELLKPIMDDNDTVTIFTMNKYITPHMVEKLDRSAYVYEQPKEEKEADPDETEDEVDTEDEESE